MSHPLSESEVRHVAKLSRLNLTDEQITDFTTQLAAVLDYISKLNELDVEGVDPMAHALDTANVTRSDELGPCLPVEAALTNAPQKSPPFFQVPKVLGDGSSA